MSDASTTLADLLTARMSALWGLPVEIENVRKLPGGARKETWSADARTAGRAVRSLIVRRDPEGTPQADEMAREAAAFAAARAAGVPVPEVYDHGDSAMGSPYLLMERLVGETIPRKLLRDEQYAAVRPALARELGKTLARIHAIDPDLVPGLPKEDPLLQLSELYSGFGEARPALDLGLRWLAENQPPSGGDTLVHGDFRNGNLLIDSAGLRGVLDWELAHRGDPFEDLGWLCTKAWRFGSREPVGGFGSRDELLAGYAEAGGVAPTPETLRWWEIYGAVRWALLCRWQAERYLSGKEPSLELAVLGRRVCEQEHDVLLALGHTTPIVVTDPLDLPAGTHRSPHDKPDAAGLLRAVGAHLVEEAAGGDSAHRFRSHVAINALRIAEREHLLGAEHERAHRARLQVLGCVDDAELGDAIRTGRLDDRFDDVVAAVRAAVTDKLTVANPRHLALPA